MILRLQWQSHRGLIPSGFYDTRATEALMTMDEILLAACQDAGFLSRFWEKIHKTEGCWLWVAASSGDGYGAIKLPGGGPQARSHRVAWTLAHGLIPDGICVLHRCDVPLCVNPSHLFLGTHGDNAADRAGKGRNGDQRGELSRTGTLTEADVWALRGMVGMTQQEMADAVGCSQPTVSEILSGKTWGHIR